MKKKDFEMDTIMLKVKWPEVNQVDDEECIG